MRGLVFRRARNFLLFLLVGLQISLWVFWGRYSLDDSVFRVAVQEFTRVISTGNAPTAAPEFFFVGSELENSLSDVTLGVAQKELGNLGIKLIFERDLTPEYTMPKAGAVSSRFYIYVSWCNPFFALVEIEDGYGPEFILAGNSTQEFYVFVFGKWILLKRFESHSLLW